MKVSEVDLNTYVEVTDIRDMQRELYKLFFAFHKICEENNLTYNMYGGTLLGAVRHQGMIPWDDDVDVSMPRPDYEKFIDIVNKNYNSEYVVYVFPKENYAYPFMKFGCNNSLLLEPIHNKYNKLTLYIDIFPIDGCAEDIALREKYFSRLKELKRKRVICISRPAKSSTITGKIKNVLRHCRAGLFRLKGYRKFLSEEIKISKIYDFQNAKHVCCLASSWFEKGVITKEEYLDRVLYKFGEYEFWGMRDYDRHLTNLYGDYMQPPPIENRVSKHNYHLFFNKTKLSEEHNG